MDKNVHITANLDGTITTKTRNHGENAEDELTELGFMPSNGKRAANLIFQNRNLQVKNWNGSNPTILNARRILCDIVPALSLTKIKEVNGINSYSYKFDRIAKILKCGSKLVYRNYDNSLFQNKLSSLDKDLPEYLANLVINWRVTHTDGKFKDISPFMKYKLESFLMDCLVQNITPNGMGSDNVQDICLTKKSERRFFDLSNDYYRTMLLQFLMENSYFDTPSNSRYPTHTILADNTIYLSFQIKLKYSKDYDRGMSLVEYQSFVDTGNI